MKIVIALAAQEDLLAGHQFYEQQAEGIGDYFLGSGNIAGSRVRNKLAMTKVHS